MAIVGLRGAATPALLRIFEESSDRNLLDEAAQTLCGCLGYSQRLGPVGTPDARWDNFVGSQKGAMSPKAWNRLQYARVTEFWF